MQKIEREFLLTDDSVNVYGFRLLTAGLMLDKVKSNPIGYRMHKREDGVLVRWEDLTIRNNALYGKPTINLSNPLGKQTSEEVQNGFLNAASVGKIVVVSFSESPDLMLEGQIGPTVTQWYPKEISLVDLPGNENALADALQLVDEQDKEIKLADFISQTLQKQPLGLLGGFNQNLKFQNTIMKKSIISLLALASINLADNSDDSVVLHHLQDLVEKAKKLPELEGKMATLKTEKDRAVQDLVDYKAKQSEAHIKAISEAGLKAGKLTPALVADLSLKYADDAEGYQKLVDGLPAYKTVTSEIEQGEQYVKDLAAKSWDELDKAGELPNLKAANIEVFKAKFKNKFGTAYTG